ncbi:AcrR family transcriptional regulator [Mycolicibacterium sp. BK556]|uniref:TetR/AcrR family transcriptional regulator n=1 Tax=Mycobacteriaceae TaxID=1762 RepID=UPI00105FDD5C|nr:MULTISPECIES: TetR/AcrR family transcriptional regulator [Mycobacteriaceae]MBB3606147.1 AcrR family transcriptional regulator [Mycolicibacterium sp. BK556]MBB3632725.1 AcrR family transcriptional regulator [Mycolicibacterium sp. BK607]MBB3754074.1 AcrR family transcriptional regulator [Mycolicibacterium sp. BK634]TDO17951.1 TetR family transcriptional regulator [Mycobacterium sp. BK086]
MASQGQPRRGRKPTLSREIVIEAALDLIDSDGLGALNLRKLADRMGISAMTPYHYFEDKADLLSAMIEYAMTPLANDLDPNLSSDKQIGAAMLDLHRILDRHPGVVDLIIAESDKLRLDEFRQSLIATLQKAGLSRPRSADVLRSLTSYVLGYTMLNRLRPEQPNRSAPPDSFDVGLEMMMRSLREELGG